MINKMQMQHRLQDKLNRDNAQLLATYLLTLEQMAISDYYQQDAKYWIQALQGALQRYQASLRRYTPQLNQSDKLTLQHSLNRELFYKLSLL